jgi:predicted amidohydrolase YtcJ
MRFSGDGPIGTIAAKRAPWVALGAAALVCAGVLMLARASTPADASPKAGKGKATKAAATVMKNGFVYTVDAKNSVAQALAIGADGEILAVGNNRSVQRFVGPDTDVIDLDGKMVMPGLHEGHIHDITKPAQPTCDLEGQPLTVPEFQARIQSCLDDPALHTAEPGAADDFLVVSNFYMQFLRPGGTHPHKSMLDALDTDRPIYAPGIFGHTYLVNQNALDLAGITRDTPDPDGGRIDHDPDGEPNGLLEDAAAGLVTRFIPPPPPLTDQQRVQLAAERMQDFSQEGITSFFVPGIPANPRTLSTFNTLQDEGRLTARAHFALLASFGDLRNPGPMYDRLEQQRSQFENPDEVSRSVRSWRPGVQSGPTLVPEPGVSIDGAKIFLDGILQAPGQTAAVKEPYLENVGTIDDPVYAPRTDEGAFGELYADADLLGPVVAGLERRGFQSHIHAIGDKAVEVALDSFLHAKEENGTPLERRAHETIAHSELVHPDDYWKFGAAGVTASMGLQWAKPAPDSTEAVKPYMSGDRYDLYEPTVPITNAGGKVSLGSDCCVDPFNEWFSLEVGILREADWGPEFPEFEGKVNALPGLSVAEGIRAVTINGAYQMHQAQVTGSLEQGKLADLLVLNQNITKVDPDRIGDTEPLLTMVGGKKVWVDPSVQDEWGAPSTWTSD